MAAAGTGSILVLGPGGEVVGIVTDRDLRRRVLAAGRSSQDTVEAVMSSPVVSISPEAFALEALLEMTRRAIHHLAVVEGGRLVGVVSSHDLLGTHALAPLEVSRRIQAARTLEDVRATMPDQLGAIRALVAQDLSGYEIGRVAAELNDHVVRKVLELAQERLGAEGVGRAPVPFCWLALGSEGRREQTLRTDQDNGLLYADAPGLDPLAERYFARLAERTIGILVDLGYPRCPADAMASNPRWRRPLAAWCGYFAEWIRDPTPENLLHASVFLDFRAVEGETRLADGLRDEIRTQVTSWRSFPRHLAKVAVSQGSPLGLFGRFLLRRENGVRGLDVKLSGMLPLVNVLRAYAIELGLGETNTIERLEASARIGRCFTEGEVADVREAYETLFRLRLGHQLARLDAGGPPDNLIDPRALARSEQQRLREALRVVRRLQGKAEDRYFTEAL
jgi:CBS domain-containing protein